MYTFPLSALDEDYGTEVPLALIPVLVGEEFAGVGLVEASVPYAVGAPSGWPLPVALTWADLDAWDATISRTVTLHLVGSNVTDAFTLDPESGRLRMGPRRASCPSPWTCDGRWR